MVFSSYVFILLFLPAVLCGYYILSHYKKSLFQRLFLIAASLFFYAYFNVSYLGLIIASIAVNYTAAQWIQKTRGKISKLLLTLGVLFNVGLLGYFKYYDFFVENINAVFGTDFALKHILLPLGISFFTFQQLSFLVSVYRREEKVERLRDYSLFVTFFPQLVAGPIERSGSLLRQLREERRFDGVRARAGLVRMAWGLFMKCVVADRLALFVDTVFRQPEDLPGSAAALAVVLFTFQIYCDFGGYSNIAIGAAQVLGVTLMENFRQPFLAASVREFWQRWHISLSSWFRDYVYIPLGGSRRGKWRAVWNNFLVFLASGLWHGAAWHYVAWGALHGLYTTAERLLPRHRGGAVRRITGTAVTFALVSGAFLLFRSDTLAGAWAMFRAIVCDFQPSALAGGGLYGFGLDRADFTVAWVALAVLAGHDLLAERMDVLAALERQALPLRWAVYLLLLFAILIFGVYGPEYDAAAFIYFEF